MIESIIKLFEIITHPNGGLNYVLKKGSSISSFILNKALSNYHIKPETIIDVGANIGQFALASNRFFKNALIYSFEPLPDAFNVLLKNIKNIKNISAFNFALGNSNGTLEFYQNEYSHSSSALPISDDHKKHFPKTTNTKQIIVPLKKLDEFVESIQFVRPSLLKLDVQGYEKQVLEGAIENMKHIDYLLFETSFVQLYKNELLFNDMHEYVTNLGFEFIAPLGFLRGNNSQILQMDVLYKNRI